MRTCLWAAIAGIVGCAWPGAAVSPSFVPAYVQGAMKPYQLVLFPFDGPEIIVPLPAELPTGMRVIGFGSDGKAIYGQKADPLNRSIGIYKIEFHPARAGVVPGSAGMGEVLCLTESSSSGRIIVFSRSLNGGVFEIDPDAGTSRPMPAGSAPGCQGISSPEILSPDGNPVIRRHGKQLDLIDMKTGESRVIKGVSADAICIWSPNGQRIECSRDNEEVAVIDVGDPFRRKTFRGGLGEWSPDSKYLLRVKSQLSCLPTLYGESLDVLEVETGKRTAVRSSHCRISGGS